MPLLDIPVGILVDLESILALSFEYTAPEEQAARNRARDWLESVVTPPARVGQPAAPMNAPGPSAPARATLPAGSAAKRKRSKPAGSNRRRKAVTTGTRRSR
jgi:hypothetical protein